MVFLMVLPIFLNQTFNKSFSNFHNRVEFDDLTMDLLFSHILNYCIVLRGKLSQKQFQLVKLPLFKSRPIILFGPLYQWRHLVFDFSVLRNADFVFNVIPINYIQEPITSDVLLLLLNWFFELSKELFEKFILDFGESRDLKILY